MRIIAHRDDVAKDDERTYFAVPMPWTNIVHDNQLEIEPGTTGADWKEELTRLTDDKESWINAEEEAVKALTTAVILYHYGAGTIGECLETASIWERG